MLSPGPQADIGSCVHALCLGFDVILEVLCGAEIMMILFVWFLCL